MSNQNQKLKSTAQASVHVATIDMEDVHSLEELRLELAEAGVPGNVIDQILETMPEEIKRDIVASHGSAHSFTLANGPANQVDKAIDKLVDEITKTGGEVSGIGDMKYVDSPSEIKARVEAATKEKARRATEGASRSDQAKRQLFETLGGEKTQGVSFEESKALAEMLMEIYDLSKQEREERLTVMEIMADLATLNPMGSLPEKPEIEILGYLTKLSNTRGASDPGVCLNDVTEYILKDMPKPLREIADLLLEIRGIVKGLPDKDAEKSETGPKAEKDSGNNEVSYHHVDGAVAEIRRLKEKFHKDAETYGAYDEKMEAGQPCYLVDKDMVLRQRDTGTLYTVTEVSGNGDVKIKPLNIGLYSKKFKQDNFNEFFLEFEFHSMKK